MATSRGFAQFSRRMAFLSKKFGKNTEKAIKRAAIAADDTVVTMTPVDTGRARANWIVSFRKPSTAKLKGTDKSGSGTQAKGLAVINRWTVVAGPIFITNNLPYIVSLDEGSSRKAPEGMSAAAIQAARRQFGNVKLLKGF